MTTDRILSPLQGLNSFCSLTQGGARFTSLALGYHLSGFQPFQVEPPHVGCHGLKSVSAFAFTAESILISSGQGAFETFARQFLRRVNCEFAGDGGGLHLNGAMVAGAGTQPSPPLPVTHH